VDRLTGVSNFEMPAENYSYDGVGNRTASHLSASYSYQPFNKLTSTANAGYVYDNNGNLISKTDGSGTTTFSYDEENRLKQVTLPVGLTVSYAYDGLGRRIQRTTSAGGNARYIYDGHDALIDLNADWSVATTYFNDLGIDNHLRQTSASTGVSYFLTDHLGSTSALTNASGSFSETISYDSFGNSTGSARTRYGYTGRERDPDTGLLFYRARWYDPQVGRFTSDDPAGFRGGSNWYGYVTNNVVNSIDPLGLWAPAAHESIIDLAFQGCLSESQRKKLKDASAYVDGLFNGGQSEQYAYQHGMRGGSDQSEIVARNAADNFIGLQEQLARKAAPRGCKDGYQNISNKALWEFGQALHTITDMTSPVHQGFQVWHGPPYPTGITPIDVYRYSEWLSYVEQHHKRETLEVLNSDLIRRASIVKAARKAFADTFGDCGCCTD